MEVIDISIIYRRQQGKDRYLGSGIRINRKPPPPISTDNICVFNPYPVLINHRKHEGQIYRDANGGFENRGKPRYHSDWFE